jgi:4-amino-4-deoxy-L-arabinose transferase-like glycosyltransferase
MSNTNRQHQKKTVRKQISLPKWIMAVIFCAIALNIATLTYCLGFASYDDGIAAEGARLILHGKIPYKDFWTMYPPGTFYLNAMALSFLGERIASIRVFGLLLGILQAALVYLILKTTVRSKVGAYIALLHTFH